MNKLVVALLTGCTLAGAGVAVAAPNAASEIRTAAAHASLAAKASDVQSVHTHLHHVLNCLVGPSGKGFDVTNANPCAGSGNGAIPDSTYPASKKQLRAAAKYAMSGIAQTDLARAQKRAIDVEGAIARAK
ncbi:MAG: hypothetical protein ABI740_01375 [Alphaproteobacteria bacterium]